MTAKKRQKQEQVNFRTTPDVRSRLQTSADERGLTFNKEVNRRLDESLNGPDNSDATQVPGLLAIAAAMNAAGHAAAALPGQPASENWWDNPYAFDQAARAANYVLEALRPPGKIVKPGLFSGKIGNVDLDSAAENLGWGVASVVIEEIATGKWRALSNKERIPKLRQNLGDNLVARVGLFHRRGIKQ